MSPTSPNEASDSKKRTTRSRKLAEMEEHNTINDSKSDKSSFTSKQVSKKKKLIEKMINDSRVSESECEVKGCNEDVNIKVESDKENHNPQVNQDQTEEQLEKRIKTDEVQSTGVKVPNTKPAISRCEYCRQKMDLDLKLYQGHPNGAVEEQIALIDPKLCLFTGDESFIHESDERPQNKLTYFR